jgi:RNA polymerase sigma factor (sigma-70 family)
MGLTFLVRGRNLLSYNLNWFVMKSIENEFERVINCDELLFEMRNVAVKAAESKLTGNYLFWSEDIVQDVLFKVYLSMEKYDGNKSHVYASVYRITINACIDLMRNQSIKKTMRIDEISLVESYTEYPDCFEREEVYLLLEQSINGLSELDERLITLKYYKGKSSREISTILNIPENQVPVFMQRARMRLGNNFKNYNIAA